MSASVRATSRKKKPVTAVAPWYGSNRMLAEHVGRELAGCAWVGIAFAGGMCEVPQIAARTINVNDLHRHLINLGSVIAHPTLGPRLYRHLRRVPFHPDALAAAQNRCRERERCQGDADELFATGNGDYRFDGPNVEWAIDYFVVAWMSRHGTAGTPGEFTGGISTRWDAGGGDSAAHFHGAVRSLPMWRRTLRRCNFTAFDCFDFLDSCKDEPGHGIYCDAPFPGPGDSYTHSFTYRQQTELAGRLGKFKRSRVVIRYYRHPLIEELYPRSRWWWVERQGRKQTNGASEEVLILNGPSLASREAA